MGRDAQADVVIVGAGAAGLSAAWEVARAGLRVTMLEAFPSYGGAAAMSGGGTCMVGTPLQRARGIHDSVDLALRDWSHVGGGSEDIQWARLYLERSCEDLYQWLQGLGVLWDDLHHHEGNSVPRWHHPHRGGAGVTTALHDALRHQRVDWRCATRAIRLAVGESRVEGVVAQAEADGRQSLIRCDVLLIATGGFQNDAAMLAEYGPEVGAGSRLLAGGAPQARGDGHRLLREAGATFTHLDHLWLYPVGTPNHRDPSGRRGVIVRGVANEIWVNAAGVRFHDENLRGGASGTPALLAQHPATCWGIFDRNEADRIRLLDDPHFSLDGASDTPLRDRIAAFLAESPHVHVDGTVAGVARAAGLPADRVVATVDRFNGWISEARPRDPDFGRDLTAARPIGEPPFFAVQYFPLAQKNLGGVRTDLGCRVVSTAGATIPGLYAAGEVAGMAGGHINGRGGLEGTMFGPSLFSGRVAGRTMVADLGVH